MITGHRVSHNPASMVNDRRLRCLNASNSIYAVYDTREKSRGPLESVRMGSILYVNRLL